MRSPIFIRALSDAEYDTLKQGLRSADAFVLRRCQILLASARGARAPQIAVQLGCDDQTVLDALHAFNAVGLAALTKGSSRPKHTRVAFTPDQAEQLRALAHRSPREFGLATSVWTLDLLADVSVAEGLCPPRVSGEPNRATLPRWGVRWKRAKKCTTSTEPAYLPKNAAATA